MPFVIPLTVSPPTQNPMDSKSGVQVCSFVEFTWGAAGVARYARWGSDLVYNTFTFTSCPNLSVDLGEQHGGVEDSPAKVSMPAVLEPAVRCLGQRVGPITCKIYKGDPNDLAGTARMVFKGKVALSESNPISRAGICVLTVNGLKAALQAALGIIVDEKCPWTFGDEICGYDLEAQMRTGLITGIYGPTVSVQQAVGFTDAVDGWWRAGSITYDGYSITIKDWIPPDVFILVRTPPKEWAGVIAQFRPGCIKLIPACRERDREESFGGMGGYMPNRNPIVTKGEQ